MKTMSCHVCNSSSLSPIYRSDESWSLTSTCKVIEDATNIDFCDACGHLQTQPIFDEKKYYSENYQILVNSFDEDQLVVDANGKSEFRSTAQAELLLNSLNLNPGAKVLDFGCAKGATAYQLKTNRPGWQVCLFDQSSSYMGFWDQHLNGFESASEVMPDCWEEQFDAVVSCYVLEHISDLSTTLSSIRKVLKSNGVLQFIVPNLWDNCADFLVADHVNHFTQSSLETVVNRSGFEIQNINRDAISGAWFVSVKKDSSQVSKTLTDIKEMKEKALDISLFWKTANDRILDFEQESNGRSAAVYGAGFYGAYIFNVLNNSNLVECFIDANPHRQGQEFFEKSIIPPNELPECIEVIYAGLNPKVSHKILTEYSSGCWRELSHKIFHFEQKHLYREAVA